MRHQLSSWAGHVCLRGQYKILLYSAKNSHVNFNVVKNIGFGKGEENSNDVRSMKRGFFIISTADREI